MATTRPRPVCTPRALALGAAVVVAIMLPALRADARGCLTGTAAEHDADAGEVRAALDAVDASCPCSSYPAGARHAYEACFRSTIDALARTATLSRHCVGEARRIIRASVCGRSIADPLPCIRGRGERLSCRIEARTRCTATRLGPSLTSLAACPTFTRCLEAADTDHDLRIARPEDSGACAGPRCGDGVLDASEECDDGNRISFDGCSATCVAEVDCNPDGNWPLAEPIAYSCASVGPGEPPFYQGIDRIVLSDHGRALDALAAPGSLPPGAPLSCAGSPVDRVDARFTLNECFFVARVVASFRDATTLTGTITLSHQNDTGLPCTPNPLFDCPPVTYPFSATRE